MATENAQQPQDLSEDEQFAAAVKGNPLFEGMPHTSDTPAVPSAADTATGHPAPASGAPAPNAGDDGKQTPAGDANAQPAPAGDAGDANTDDGNAAAAAPDPNAEPFPGYNALLP